MRTCCKPDLVIDDDVNRAAGAIPPQRRKGECLANNTLASEGRITMQQNADHLLARCILR